MTSTNENKSCNKYKVLLFNRILQTAFTLSSRYNRIMFNKYLLENIEEIVQKYKSPLFIFLNNNLY